MSLPAHQGRAAKFSSLTRAERGIIWALHASFRLPAMHTYADLNDSLFHGLRTIRAGTTLDAQLLGEAVDLKESNWDPHETRLDALLAVTHANHVLKSWFSWHRWLGSDPKRAHGSASKPATPTAARQRT